MIFHSRIFKHALAPKRLNWPSTGPINTCQSKRASTPTLFKPQHRSSSVVTSRLYFTPASGTRTFVCTRSLKRRALQRSIWSSITIYPVLRRSNSLKQVKLARLLEQLHTTRRDQRYLSRCNRLSTGTSLNRLGNNPQIQSHHWFPIRS